jgi:hypothetical protein
VSAQQGNTGSKPAATIPQFERNNKTIFEDNLSSYSPDLFSMAFFILAINLNGHAYTYASTFKHNDSKKNLYLLATMASSLDSAFSLIGRTILCSNHELCTLAVDSIRLMIFDLLKKMTLGLAFVILVQENCEKFKLLKNGQLIYLNAFAPIIYILSPIFKILEISASDYPIKDTYAIIPKLFNILYAINQVLLVVTLIFLLKNGVQKVRPNLIIHVRNLTILTMANCIVDFTCMILFQIFPLSSELSGILSLTWALNILIYCCCNDLFTQSITIFTTSVSALNGKETA